MQNKTLRQKLTGILEGVVGEDKKPRITGGIVTESTVKWARIDGYNQALADIRNCIPETARKVIEWVGDRETQIYNSLAYKLIMMGMQADKVTDIIASLAGEDEGDNGKEV